MTILFSEHSPKRPRRPRGRVPSAREGRGGEGIYAENREKMKKPNRAKELNP